MTDDLREELAEALTAHLPGYVDGTCGCGDGTDTDVRHLTDALLPLIRDHTAVQVEQARRDERERAACDLDTMQAAYSGEAEVQRGLRIGAILIRKIAEADDGTQ